MHVSGRLARPARLAGRGRRWLAACLLPWLWLAPGQGQAAPAEAEWSCGPPSLGAPCPQAGPATLPMGDGTPRGLGNPVHLDSGRKYQHETDWHAHDGELGLEVVRHYQSADPRDTGLGRGWRLSYDTRVYPVGKGWQVVQADGSRLWFLPGEDPVGPCFAVGVDAGRFHRLPAGGYLWIWPNGRRLRFDAQGLLVEIQGRDGAILTLWRGQVPGRPDFGRLLRVRDPRGRDMHLHYDGPRLAAIRLPGGELRYWHTSGNRLRAVSYPSGRARLYAYQPSHQGTGAGADARLTATWWWDPAAGLVPRWAWTYDDHGRVVEVRPGGRQGPRVALSYGHGAAAVPAEREGVDEGREPGAGLVAGLGAGAIGAAPSVMTLRLPGSTEGLPRQLRLEWAAPTASGIATARSPLAASRAPFSLTPAGPAGLPWRVVESGWRVAGMPGAPPTPVWREWRWQAAPAPAAGAEDERRGWRLLRAGPAAAWPDPARAAAGWPGLRLWRDDLGSVWRWESAITGRFERQALAGEPSSEQWRFGNGGTWRFEYDGQERLVRWHRREPGGGEDVIDVTREPGVVRIVSVHERETWRQIVAAEGRAGSEMAGGEASGEDGAGMAASGTAAGVRRRVEREALGTAPPWQYEEALWRDATGRLLAHDLPEGGRLEYRRDHMGAVSGILWRPAEGPERWLYQRDASGVRLANGSRVGADFQGGQLALLWQALPDGRLVLAHRRSYGAFGQAVAESLRVAGRPPRHRQLAYDAQGRLAVVAQDGIAQWLAWGPSGEARARREAPVRGAAPAPSRPAPEALREASGLPRALAGRQLHYGPGRRLAAVEMGDGRQLRYFHNARGEQIARDDGQQTTQSLFLEHQRVAEAGWRGGGWQVARRLVLAGELPVAWIEYHPSAAGAPATVFTLHADAMGVPLAATDDTGRLRWSAEADAWGKVQAEAGGVGLALRLPGQWADPLTGWYDNYLRTYDPAWGHYLEPDPAGPPGAQAAGVGSATAFGYAGHQPRRWLDPTGLVLFAFDGTLQDAGSGANVHRLSLWYRDAAAVAAGLASAYYHAGPGGWPLVDLDAAMAWSAERIVQTQWDLLLRHLAAFETAVDPVALDLLGYSRGAALARHFANRIVGKVRQGRFWDWDDELGAVTACVDTRFLGLFDTVAQFGLLGARDAVFDLAVAPAWRGVAHAVALHERRALFPLLSIGGPEGELPAGWEERPFVGAHGDIGGGLVGSAGLTPGEAALSDASLRWMAEQAEALGAVLDRDEAPAAGEWAWLHDFRTPYQRLAGWQHDQAGGPLPGVAASDRAVLAASGAPWLAAQSGHALLGRAQRVSAEAWIERTERWLGHPDPAVGRVDLDAYQQWLDGLP